MPLDNGSNVRNLHNCCPIIIIQLALPLFLFPLPFKCFPGRIRIWFFCFVFVFFFEYCFNEFSVKCRVNDILANPLPVLATPTETKVLRSDRGKHQRKVSWLCNTHAHTHIEGERKRHNLCVCMCVCLYVCVCVCECAWQIALTSVARWRHFVSQLFNSSFSTVFISDFRWKQVQNMRIRYISTPPAAATATATNASASASVFCLCHQNGIWN